MPGKWRGWLWPSLLLWLCLAFPTIVGAADPALREELRQLLREEPGLVWDILAQDRERLYELAAQGADLGAKRRFRTRVLSFKANPLQPALEEDRPWKGASQAPVAVVEYSDFTCSACAKGAEQIRKLLSLHPGKYRVLLKHTPEGELARQLASHCEASARQDPAKAWRFHDEVFARAAQIKKDKLAEVETILAELGLDRARLARDLADPLIAQRLQADRQESDRRGSTVLPPTWCRACPWRGRFRRRSSRRCSRSWPANQPVAAPRQK